MIVNLFCNNVYLHENDSDTNLLQAWNTQTNADLSLTGPVGQVYTMVVGNDLLFAGTQVMLIFLLLMFSPDTAFQVIFQVGKCLAYLVSDFDCVIHTCTELCLLSNFVCCMLS